MLKSVAYLFLFLGLSLLLATGRLLYLRSVPLPPLETVQAVENVAAASTITALAIPALELTLPVLPAEITDSRWQIHNQAVNHLITSSLPGNGGNIVLYAHNWSNLLGGLKRLTPGDLIELQVGQDLFRYQVDSLKTVSPTDTSIYAPTNDERLTVYTCTGFLDQARLVVTALPQDSS